MEENKKVSPQNVFLHFFAIIMLYVSTANVITLLFQYINLFIPDNLSPYETTGQLMAIRFSIASLIIIFPLYIWTSWFLGRRYIKNPLIKDMLTRKWLIYFTIFVAALIITGDLVNIVWTFLNGELKLRFILKSISVLAVAATVFGYYLWDIKKEKNTKYLKAFVIAVSVIVLALIVTGFFFIGSPQTERLKRFDQQRVADLQNIQGMIIEYWRGKQVVPAKLSDLENSINGFKMPIDPETSQAYEYSVKGTNAFELCATFSLKGDSASDKAYPVAPYGGDQNWQHETGRTCFERTIDKDLYPPLIKTQ